MRISLAIIAKDQVGKVESICEKYADYFSEVVVAVDQRYEEFGQLTAKFPTLRVLQYQRNQAEMEFGGIFFDRKRNFLASNLDCDYYFRLDTDDEIDRPENLNKLFAKVEAAKPSVVYCFYEYSRDINGVMNGAHWRDTIIKNDKSLYWNKIIHENVICKDMQSFRMEMVEDIRIVHKTDANHSDESAIRNVKYLIYEYNRDKEKTDPRTIAYLGRTFLSLQKFKEAKFFLVKHITASGWDEDRYMSRVQLSEVHKSLEELEEAKLVALEAIDERPDYPDAYLKLSEIYFEMQNWEKAIHWGEIGVKTPAPKSMMIVDPSSHTWRPALILAYSYFMKDDYEKAYKLMEYVKKYASNIEFVKNNSQMFEKAYEEYNFVKSFLNVLGFTKKNNGDVAQLFNSLPESLNENAHIITLKNRHLPMKKWERDSVVIFCPKSLEKWADPSVATGIGGSEEAVVYMARELVKLGKKVTVYNGCEDLEGVYNGVTYLSNHRFNPRDEFDTIISWRMSIYGFPIKGRNRWVWLHDVPPTVEFQESHLKNLDKIIVLSRFQRGLLPPFVKDDKVFISSNGINVEDFTDLGVKREPYRCIYASSYDRGLEQFLTIWPEVIKAVPQAELHIFYGWNNIDELIRTGDMKLKAFKDKMVALMYQPGVFHHGRVGHKQLNEEYQKATFYTYPSSFEEISCIAAMKAQANGCYPVTTDYAALAETVKYGTKINGSMSNENVQEEYVSVLINLLQTLNIPAERRVDEFSWSNVAKDWVSVIDASQRDYIDDRLGWIRDHVSRDAKIVDIGGNDGHTFEGFNRDNVTTVDIDLYDIPNFVRADAQELPFSDKQFDVAVLAEILEHVPDPIKAMKEARRVAKRVIITVPYEHEWEPELLPFHGIDDHARVEAATREELAKKGNPRCKDFYTADNYEHLYHCRHYTKELLEEHLTLAGYENFDVKKIVSGKWVWFGVVDAS